MKALSLKQPFAELVVSGKKTIELRNWNTKYRGKFLVHASKNADVESMKAFGFSFLPLGKIVGEAEIVGVKEYKDDEEHMRDKGQHLADSSWGKYGFMLKDARRLDGPQAKGKLNFWEFNPQ